MNTPDHNKILKRTAKPILTGSGLIQKGQSRTWLDDQYWYTTIVEFQPSNWSKGTYLNVGVCFHWYEKDYLSFDIGHREMAFCEFKNPEQFESEIHRLSQVAVNKALNYRNHLSEMQNTIEILKSTASSKTHIWEHYHLGTIYGLNRDISNSHRCYNLILENDPDTLWKENLQKQIKILMRMNESKFINSVNDIIQKSRDMKKLKEMPIKNVW